MSSPSPRQLWLIPIGVVGAAGVLAATFLLLSPGGAFVVVATAVVIALGAAPVVLGVISRRNDPLHQDNLRRDGESEAGPDRTKNDQAG